MREKILVVEDELKHIEPIKQLLEHNKYKIIIANNSDDGINEAKKKRPDLILCDIKMETNNAGFKVLRYIRNNDALKDIPFLFYTVVEDQNIIIGGMREKADDYILKKESAGIKLSRIKHHLQLRDVKKKLKDSIKYASNIQKNLMPTEEDTKDLFKDAFIFYQPKDIVSGDFYWLKKIENKTIFAVADCTGHGVSGAFVSILGISFLNEITSTLRVCNAKNILEKMRERFISCFKSNEIKDTLEIALCVIDDKKGKMQFSGVNINLHLIRNDKMIIYESVKGGPEQILTQKQFKNEDIDLKKDDIYYLFSDGYVDQPGGKEKRKLMTKGLKKLLLDNHKKPMSYQKVILEQELKVWMQDIETQTDDILVIGFRI